MFCHNCGAVYPANAHFCTRCGCARIDYSCQSAIVPQPTPVIPVPVSMAAAPVPVNMAAAPAPVNMAAEPVQVSMAAEPAPVSMTEAPVKGSHAVPLGILGGLMTLGLVLYFLTAFVG